MLAKLAAGNDRVIQEQLAYALGESKDAKMMPAIGPLFTTGSHEATYPLLLGAFVKFLGACPDPEGVELARGLFERRADPRALEAIQPRFLDQPEALLPLFSSILEAEAVAGSELPLIALRKLVALNSLEATVAALRYDPKSEGALRQQLDTLYELRMLAPAKVAAYARRHTSSADRLVAKRAQQILEKVGDR